MNRALDIINLLKKDQYIRLLIELTLGMILFNVNNIFAILFIIIISIETIFANVKNTLYIYLFLSFFDEILVLDIIQGSISRIIMLIIIVKLTTIIIKNRIKPNKYQLGIFIFFVISLIVGIITYKTISLDVLIVLANIIVFLLFSMSIKITKVDEINEFIKKLLFTIVIASLVSILYGVINNNFLLEYEGEDISYRFKGTYEPNFMSLFVNLGIASLLFIKDDIKHKWLVYLALAIMLNAVIATISITGMAITLLILVIYTIIERKELKKHLKGCAIALLLTILLFAIIKIVPNINIQQIFEKNEVEQEINSNNINSENNKSNNSTNSLEENNIINEDENIVNVNNQETNNSKQQNLNLERTNTVTTNEQNNSSEPESNASNVEQKNEIVTNENSYDNSLINRLNFLKEKLLEGDWDRISSGRIPLITTFLSASFNRPIGNILFGNDMTTKALYTNYLGGTECSHCSYIDFLYNFGIVGFVIIISYLFIITKRNIFIGQDISNIKYKNAILVIRIMLLVYAVALSLYTKRMFLIFFLL